MNQELITETDGHSGSAYDADEYSGFKVDLDAFDGPIDLLLELAKKQKVDLIQISVLALANQYIAYIEKAKSLELEVAGDSLVMAAWLTYLKSRLLLPPEEDEEDDLSSHQMEALLKFQLKRLEGMREAGDALFERPILNEDVYSRGRGQGPRIKTQMEFDLKWHDLLHAYGRIHAENEASQFQPKIRKVFKIEDALRRLSTMLGMARDWTEMDIFLPLDELSDLVVKKSAVASTFGAFLELTKKGEIDIKQDKLFGPIYARRARHQDQEDNE